MQIDIVFTDSSTLMLYLLLPAVRFLRVDRLEPELMVLDSPRTLPVKLFSSPSSLLLLRRNT
jgi:hypothetical protein